MSMPKVQSILSSKNIHNLFSHSFVEQKTYWASTMCWAWEIWQWRKQMRTLTSWAYKSLGQNKH